MGEDEDEDDAPLSRLIAAFPRSPGLKSVGYSPADAVHVREAQVKTTRGLFTTLCHGARAGHDEGDAAPSNL